MTSITQEGKYRLSIISYAKRFGVSQAARTYRRNRQFIYRLLWRYDGTMESILPRSRRPHHHPNQHTSEEIALIQRMRRRHPHDGLVVCWVRLREKGYTRSISGLYRCLKRMGLMGKKLPNPKRYIPKPYQEAKFPGEKVQVDVKIVPSACIVGEAAAQGERLVQYTAIDECTRYRYIAAFREQSTYSSMQFVQQLVKRFPFRIHTIQTDNGFEFTKRFGNNKRGDLTLFEAELLKQGIKHHKIRPYTPRHNGKVERSHRKDNEYFYASHRFYSFEDFKAQLASWNRRYNHFPMKPLHWRSPKQVLSSFLSSNVTYL